jgi:hypothetical protein
MKNMKHLKHTKTCEVFLSQSCLEIITFKTSSKALREAFRVPKKSSRIPSSKESKYSNTEDFFLVLPKKQKKIMKRKKFPQTRYFAAVAVNFPHQSKSFYAFYL